MAKKPKKRSFEFLTPKVTPIPKRPVRKIDQYRYNSEIKQLERYQVEVVETIHESSLREQDETEGNEHESENNETSD